MPKRSKKSLDSLYWAEVRCLSCFFSVFVLSHGFVSFAQGSADNVGLPENWQEIDNPLHLETLCIEMDPVSGIWIGHSDGVAYYDGWEWRNHEIPSQIGTGPVRAICAASGGGIYVTTPSGLLRLLGGEWSLLHGSTQEEGIYGGSVLYEADSGDIWLGYSRGLLRVRLDGEIEEIDLGMTVLAICEDYEGYLWWVEGVSRKVLRAPIGEGEFPESIDWEIMLSDSEEHVSLASLARSSDNRIWLGSVRNEDRLRYYDLQQGIWSERELLRKGTSQVVYDLGVGDSGTIWASTQSALMMFQGSRVESFRYPDVPIQQDRSVVAISDDGYLWVVERHGRIFRIATQGQLWESFEGLIFQCEVSGRRWFIDEDNRVHYQFVGDGSSSAIPIYDTSLIEYPTAIYSTRDGRLWAIGSHEGRAALSIYDGVNWSLYSFPEFATGFDSAAFFETHSGAVLLGSGQRANWKPHLLRGALKVWWKGDSLEAEPIISSVIPDHVHGIVETEPGENWFSGIRFVMQDDSGFQNRFSELGVKGGGWISCITPSEEGGFWGVSYGRGVFRYRSGGFEWFRRKNSGFESNSLIHIVALDGNNAMALANDSIYRFDGKDWWSSIDLPLDYGLSRGMGELRRGTGNQLWLNVSHPNWQSRMMQKNRYAKGREPHFSSYRYLMDEDAPRTSLIMIPSRTEDIRSFSALLGGSDFWSRTPLGALQFSYRMDGGSWSPFSGIRNLDFQQLNEGTHRLEARARDLDGNVDRVGASLVFVIDIPFWQETWFVPLLIVSIVLIVGLVAMAMIARSRGLVELEQQKLNFFTNLSHEIRTPLALIMAPLERALRKETSVEIREYLEQACKSSQDLKHSIDQLLDFRRAESGVMRVRLEPIDLVRFGQDLIQGFVGIAEEKKQAIAFSSDLAKYECRVDGEKLKNVFNNLLLNAIRYSPEYAETRLTFSVRERHSGAEACFVVEDSGIGMEKEFLKIAFKPFSRRRDTRARSVKGTGIGLAYVKELLEICNGSINLESPADPTNEKYPGTRVTIVLPVEPLDVLMLENDEADQPPVLGSDEQESVNNRPVVLLVEDDDELRTFVSKELADQYLVIRAIDGKDGVRQAIKAVPDIILADRMMPVMDGVEFCEKIRENLATSHIPIIMMTAATGSDRELEGLRAGANDYIGKPFSMESVMARLANQLVVRDRLKLKLRNDYEKATDSTEVELPLLDDPFLNRVDELIEKRLGDFEFDVEELARSMAMSRTSLYRKMNAVAGLSPAALIKRARMRQAAAELLGTEEYVGIIMERVGIVEKRTFNKWFKEAYGSSPTEYRKKNWGREA